MKIKLDWKKIILFVVVTGGLVFIMRSYNMSYLTSFLMSLGILLLLFVGDNYARELDEKIKKKRENKDKNNNQD